MIDYGVFFVVFNVILLLFVIHLKDFFCDLQTAWLLVLSMKPSSYIWLEFGLFSTILYTSLSMYTYIYNYYKNSISQPVLQLGTPLLCNHWAQVSYVIQIKICAEYRDMLPRPRLVCQEPGLMPIGRSPGVPDKSSRGLGSMPRYSAHILICFKAYIFLFFFHSPVGLVGNFAGLPVCTVPSAIVHCNQNEAGHQTMKAPRMPCWGAAGPSKHSMAFKSQSGENDRYNGWNLYQWEVFSTRTKWMEIL